MTSLAVLKHTPASLVSKKRVLQFNVAAVAASLACPSLLLSWACALIVASYCCSVGWRGCDAAVGRITVMAHNLHGAQAVSYTQPALQCVADQQQPNA